MAFLGDNGSTNDIGRCANGGCVSADIGTNGERIRQNVKWYCRGGKGLNDRNHSSGKRDVVDKGTGNGRYPKDNGNNDIRITTADVTDELGNKFQTAGILEASDDQEQTHEE